MDKINSFPKTVTIINKEHRQNNTVGLITGCFDILHIGHVELFRFAKSKSDILVVGLESEETVRQSKGPGRPVHSLSQRSLILSQLVSIDYVFPIPLKVKFAYDDAIKNQYLDLVRRLRPDFLFTSSTTDAYLDQKRSSLKEIGVHLVEFTASFPVSTSSILSQIIIQ